MNINLVDIPRYYTAFAEWLGCIVAIVMLPKRLSIKKLIPVCALFLVIQIVFLEATDDVPLVMWLPCMGFALALMYFFLYICCADNTNIGYSCAHGFIWAEFTASFEWQLYYYFIYSRGYESLAIGISFLVGIDVLLALVMVGIHRHLFHGEIIVVSKYETMSVAMIVVLAFAFSNISFWHADTPFSAQIERDIFWTRTLVDLCGLIIIYMYHMSRKETRMENEISTIRHVLDLQYYQYQKYRESIDVIHYKYHDLKHQIQGLRTPMTQEEREKWIDELEQDLSIYESDVQTGNAVLDTVLTGKMLYCQQHQIELTCVVDGTLLDFVRVKDLCAIFGNALDNAIESVQKLDHPEERLIHLTVSEQKGFVFIVVENYCAVPPHFIEGLPRTTKQEAHKHGFGIKSIQYTVKQYEGSVQVEYKNNWFELKILLPMRQQAASHG